MEVRILKIEEYSHIVLPSKDSNTIFYIIFSLFAPTFVTAFCIILSLLIELWYNIYIRIVCMVSDKFSSNVLRYLQELLDHVVLLAKFDPATQKKSPRIQFLSTFFFLSKQMACTPVSPFPLSHWTAWWRIYLLK